MFERQIEPILLSLAKDRPRTAPRPVQPPPSVETEVDAAPMEGYSPTPGSFGTFRRQLDPNQNGAESRVTAYAFYLWNYEKKDTFTKDEVSGCFRAGGESPPDDFPDAFTSLQEKRILHPAAKEGTWRLTPKGRNRVRKLLV